MVIIDGVEMLCPPEPDAEKVIAKLQRIATSLDNNHPKMAEAVRQAIQVIQLDIDKIEYLKSVLAHRSDDGEEWD